MKVRLHRPATFLTVTRYHECIDSAYRPLSLYKLERKLLLVDNSGILNNEWSRKSIGFKITFVFIYCYYVFIRDITVGQL